MLQQSIKPLSPLRDVLFVSSFIKESILKSSISLAPVNEAPLWLRLLARGDYCAFGRTIYVPSHHYALVSSEAPSDRNMATAKLCKWFMSIHDFEDISKLTAIKLLCFNKHILHYFLYEFFFLKGCDHPQKDLVVLGFLSSRKNWYGRRIPYDKSLEYLTTLLAVHANRQKELAE